MKRSIDIDDRIKHALMSGETATIYSNKKSLIPSVILAGRVKIIYQSFEAT
jgi:hypothetical protein